MATIVIKLERGQCGADKTFMGLSGGADQGRKTRRQSGIEAQSLKCI